MIARPEALEKLLTVLRSFPSVGPKMSERIAFYLLNVPTEQMLAMLLTIQEAHEKVRPCSVCGYWDDVSPCRICSDQERDSELLCVIESSQDLIALSRVKDYKGYYHVLGGALSPLDGIGPQDLNIDSLYNRLEEGKIKEVILALNADMEGETTSQYLYKQIQTLVDQKKNSSSDFPTISVTRLAQGLPAGGELVYMDEITLARALDGRKVLQSTNQS